jgi:hypothetical protein
VVDGIAGIAVAMAAVAAGATAGKFFFHPQVSQPRAAVHFESKPQNLCWRHPERSRSSGEVKDLPLTRPSARAQLHRSRDSCGLPSRIEANTIRAKRLV